MYIFLLQIEITQVQAGFLFGSILGAILGIIPLVLGFIKKKLKYGIIGFVGAIIGNAILGLILSIPIISICIYLILKNPTAGEPAEGVVVNEDPVDVSINNSENS